MDKSIQNKKVPIKSATERKEKKMTPEERKKRVELEREIGVPDPPVPNRAHTEM